MLRASSNHLPSFVFASRLPISPLLPSLNGNINFFPTSPLLKSQTPFHMMSTSCSLDFLSQYRNCRLKFNRVSRNLRETGKSGIIGAKAAFSSGTGSISEVGREILVQHLLVKDIDQKLLLELHKRASEGEDLSDLAVEYSICPSKEEGGMLGWVRKGQMVPEFEEAAFSAPLNKIVRCKTSFGWHLLQVLSEREESVLEYIHPTELHEKLQDPSFLDEAQLIDVREPDEVAKASLPGFKVLPLRQFGSWGPGISATFDPEKATYVLCHHGVRSLQVAQWLQTQGFKKVFNVSGGIHEYAVKVDPSVPTY